MDRLTRPDINAYQTALRFMDGEVKIQDINDKLLELILNGPTINGIKKDTLRHLVRQLYDALKRYEELDMTPEDIEQTMLRFSSFLMEMTGGRMSKTNYTVQAMVAEANDYQQKELEEAEEKGYDLGVDSVLRNHFDIPWAEAADLRKNINHLRELLVAEKEGRLVVLPPCKVGDTIYVIVHTFHEKLEIREGSITGFRSGTRLQYAIFRYWQGGVPFDSSVPVDDLGKAWFLSKEEAEAALAKVNNVPPKWLYRLESRTPDNGLWYNCDNDMVWGIGKLPNCKTKDLPMDYDERYHKNGRNWFSSCSRKEDLTHWYSLDDALELIRNGFVFTRYLATEYVEYEFETTFIKETALAREEIDIEELFGTDTNVGSKEEENHA